MASTDPNDATKLKGIMEAIGLANPAEIPVTEITHTVPNGNLETVMGVDEEDQIETEQEDASQLMGISTVSMVCGAINFGILLIGDSWWRRSLPEAQTCPLVASWFAEGHAARFLDQVQVPTLQVPSSLVLRTWSMRELLLIVR